MRKQLIVHPAFQFRYVVSFLFGGALMTGALVGIATAGMWLLSQDSSLTPEQQQMIFSGIPSVLGIGALGFGGVVLVLAPIALYLSNKVAGPLRRLETYLRDRLDGRSDSEQKLRTGDDLYEVAESLNRMLRKYGGKA